MVSTTSTTIYLFLSSFALVSVALPQLTRRESPSKLTQSIYDTFELVEHYAAAAYCPGNSLTSMDTAKLVCPKSNNCQKVEAAKTSIVIGIKNNPLTDVTGYVATDATNNLTVISFQGTESKKQTQADLNLYLKNISHICAGCTTHTGFWQSWDEARTLVIKHTRESQIKFPNNRIIVTGHSLGGAIATLAAAELRSSGVPIDLYTYGAPRVGNQMLADYVQTPKDKLGENHRVTHYNDPVPRLPPASMGYAHYTPEVYLSGKNQIKVALSDILTLDASTASKGTEQFTVVDVEAHRWYFNNISACYMANNPKDGTSNDLATNWAGTIITLMGNSSGLILQGASKATSTTAASAMAGLIASMGSSATSSLLGLIPGGFLAQPFLPSPATTGSLTSMGTAGLLSGLESLFGSITSKPPGRRSEQGKEKGMISGVTI